MIDDNKDNLNKDVPEKSLEQGEEVAPDSGKGVKFLLPDNWDSMLHVFSDIQNHRSDES
jgi:hypothetical protein